ncbi:MAG: T9SS type A sorting domain-containing protein [Bacteroidales bacterium]|nr:T9SS type A sorting domain-containing protein [Bacteroidales bacterium]
MKKLFFLVTMMLFASGLVYAQEWVGVNENTPVRIQENLVSSSEDEIVIDVKVGGFFQTAVKTQLGEQVVISGEDMASMLVAGAPDLPMYPISMIIGNTAEMKVSVVESSYVDIQDVEVAPSKGNFSREINPEDVPFVYGEVYQQDDFYPAQPAALDNPYILRDFRGQNAMVYPYAYNPVTKTLRVYTDLRISVKKVSDNGLNQKVATRRSNVVSPEVKASYERRFINYPANERYSFIEDEGEMLVVCVDEYKEAAEKLVNWKNISGRPTTLALTSETGNLDKLKTYIANYYASNPNLTYVLLIGEYDNLPPYEIIVTIDGMQYYTRSDNYYGRLDGDDNYEEVLVGRLSVENLKDAHNQVDRIIYYERDIKEDATWLSRGIGMGSTEGSGHYGENDYQHIDFIRDTLMNYTYTEISQKYKGINGYEPSADDYAVDFNKGVGIANYCNHGEVDRWVMGSFDTACVHNLTNDYMLPFIWTSSCRNGQFDVDECFAESWMRAVNPATNAPVGAIGGMFSWISQPWQPPMYGQDEMIAILTEWRGNYNHTLGGASLNGNMYILDMSPEDRGNTHNTWLLFGDPSMILRTQAPEKMDVYCSSSYLMVGMTNYTVNANVDFGIATLSKDGEVVASSYIKKGRANLNFPEITEEGKMQLVVVAYNKVTEIIDIEVKTPTDAFLIFNEYELNENDGQLDYGETIGLDLSIKNIGVSEASDIEVELISKSDYVTITDSKANVASMAVEEIATIEGKFKLNVAGNVPDQEELEFDVRCISGEESWSSSFSIVANAPSFVIDTIFIKNKMIEPGSSDVLYIAVKNAGHSEARNVVSEMISSSSDIVFPEATLTEEALQPGDVMEIVAFFEVDENAEKGTKYEVECSVSAGDYEIETNYYVMISQALEDFETGDFSKTDWQFEGASDWFICENAYEGTYSARSGKIADNLEKDKRNSSLLITVELVEDEEISFYHQRFCDYYAKLEFYVDGEFVQEWKGNTGYSNPNPTEWEQFTYNLTKGTHTLKWTYNKRNGEAKGEDCVYLDNIVLPPFSIISFVSPATNLKAEVNAPSVTLTWDAGADAKEYVIMRNDEQIAKVTETSFTDTLQVSGSYTYSVIAKKYDAMAEAVSVTVEVTILDVNEINVDKTNIYPNPATDVIYVNVNESFNAVIYNYQGQVVKNVNADNGQIDISDLTNGMYFLEIRTGNKVTVNKVLVR